VAIRGVRDDDERSAIVFTNGHIVNMIRQEAKK
jgi:hypothetical protein